MNNNNLELVASKVVHPCHVILRLLGRTYLRLIVKATSSLPFPSYE